MIKHNILKTILKIIGITILSIVIIFLYGYFIGTKGLKIKEYKVTITSLPNDFYGLKIVHISDLHYGFFFGEKDLENLVTKVNKLNPDIVVLTGDLVDKELENVEKQKVTDILKEIKAKIGKYAVKGNLDSKDFDQIIKDSGFTNLNDNYDIIYSSNDKIMIAGLSSNLNNSENMQNKLENIYSYIENNEIRFKILLMHEPDYIEKLKNDTFDLILAGHSHNGQVNLPFIGPIKTPNGSKKYYKNFYETKKGKLYISSGIGTSILPVRLFNKPSINFYRLVNK